MFYNEPVFFKSNNVISWKKIKTMIIWRDRSEFDTQVWGVSMASWTVPPRPDDLRRGLGDEKGEDGERRR